MGLPAAKVGNSGQQLSKSISIVGFLGLGIGAVFGSSWLLMTGIWLDTAGGPLNAIIAFALCFLIELPLVLAYYEAVPMIPLAGGELSYSYLSFGRFIGMMVGWFGVLVNIILCAWEVLAISRMLSYLFPAIANATPLYTVGGAPITIPSIIIGLVLILGIGIVQWRGAKLSSGFSTTMTITIISLALISVVIGVFYFDPQNFKPVSTKGFMDGTLSLLAMLPFSIAGWETIAKGAQEATTGINRSKMGLAVIISVLIATSMYIITLVMPAGLIPWGDMSSTNAPFATAMTEIGFPILGVMLIVAASLGVIGVYNAVFFGATRLIYAMGEYGLVPKSFTKVHPKYKSPVIAIIFVSVVASTILFLGQSFFVPLIDVAAVSYIILWGSTLASVLKLRAKYPDLERPVKYPGGKSLMYTGLFFAFLLLVAMLLPQSPASLAWPVEYILLLVLLVLGAVLYVFRDKTIPEKERQHRILGTIADEIKIHNTNGK